MSATIAASEFVTALGENDIDLYAGVPDSLLRDLAAYIDDTLPADKHVITANEGNAVALAGGYHVATGRYAAVYLQNSGLGNTINPLLSLADEAVYGLPMLLIIGWRGEPGVKDEPQHVTQGRLNNELLETMGIDYAVLDPEKWQEQVAWSVEKMREANKPVAIVVRKGVFSSYDIEDRGSELPLKREQALEAMLDAIDPSDFLVSTTGKTSREVFEIRERRGEGHSQDFLTVGGMGHASSIAMGMAMGSDARVYCIDGDGAFLMHMGAIAVAAQKAPENFRYVLINNGAHESVGGQPTVAFDIDIPAILMAAGFTSVQTVREQSELAEAMARVAETPRHALVIEVAQGSRDDLGRPTTTPAQNKADMMRQFRAGRG